MTPVVPVGGLLRGLWRSHAGYLILFDLLFVDSGQTAINIATHHAAATSPAQTIYRRARYLRATLGVTNR
jgi:hypothetical protein